MRRVLIFLIWFRKIEIKFIMSYNVKRQKDLLNINNGKPDTSSQEMWWQYWQETNRHTGKKEEPFNFKVAPPLKKNPFLTEGCTKMPPTRDHAPVQEPTYHS